jgi:hypothetical protein
LHLAWAGSDAEGNPDGVTVAWATLAPYSAREEVPVVLFGTESGGPYPGRVEGTTRDYGPPGRGWRVHHRATLAGLEPGREYYYIVGGARSRAAQDAATLPTPSPSAASSAFSAERRFTSAPARSGASGAEAVAPFSVSVFGDFGFRQKGHADETRRNLERIRAETDWTLHLGDIGYADDAFLHEPNSFSYEAVYNEWMDWMQNVTDTKPYMVAVGNHESECHSPSCIVDAAERGALRNFTAYNARWAMPSASSGGVESMWYSFNYGLAHFAVLNTETDFPGANEENRGDSQLMPAGHFAADGAYLKWLEKDLAAANAPAARAARPWVIVAGHRPIVTCGNRTAVRPSDAWEADVRRCGPHATLEPLMERYGVDLFLAGHQHSYSRFAPRRRSTAAARRTAHVIAGGAGCDEMLLRGNSKALGRALKATPEGMTPEGMILDVNVTVAGNMSVHDSPEDRVWWQRWLRSWGAWTERRLQEPDIRRECPPDAGDEGAESGSCDGPAQAPPLRGAYSVYSQGDKPSIFSTGVLTVFNETTLRWQMRNSADNAVEDEFFLRK